jgi:hypothetical protein
MLIADGSETLNIVQEEWVEAEVRAKARKVICVDEPVIVAMYHRHIPAHEAHLKAENDWVRAVVRKDKF